MHKARPVSAQEGEAKQNHKVWWGVSFSAPPAEARGDKEARFMDLKWAVRGKKEKSKKKSHIWLTLCFSTKGTRNPNSLDSSSLLVLETTKEIPKP